MTVAVSRAPNTLRALVVLLALITWASLSGWARAEVSPADLAQVGVKTPAGARAPLGLVFRDLEGRATTLGAAIGKSPALLIFEDYRCKTLCGPALAIVAAEIDRSGLRPGRDLRLIAIGLNPHETPADAARMQVVHFGAAGVVPAAWRSGSRFLTGDAGAVATAAQAMGYGYAYDPAADQYVHPVAAFVLSPDGLVVRVLTQTALTSQDLHSAVLLAGHDRIGDLVDRLSLLCHGLFPLNGKYDGAVQDGLRIAGAATVLTMAAGVGLMIWRRRTSA